MHLSANMVEINLFWLFDGLWPQFTIYLNFEGLGGGLQNELKLMGCSASCAL